MSRQSKRRTSELARIHILSKEIGMDEDEYRGLLFTIARVRSAADLDYGGRQAVISHMSQLARKMNPKRKSYPGRPNSADEPVMSRIEALLADQKLPWSYALSICKKIAKKERLEFCTDKELTSVMLAIEHGGKRGKSYHIKPKGKNDEI